MLENRRGGIFFDSHCRLSSSPTEHFSNEHAILVTSTTIYLLGIF